MKGIDSKESCDIVKYENRRYEIDLRVVLKILWDAKTIIFAIILISFLVGSIYANKLKDVWVSNAIIIPSNPVDLAEFDELVKKYQGIIYYINANFDQRIVNDSFEYFLDKNKLFDLYVDLILSKDNIVGFSHGDSEITSKLNSVTLSRVDEDRVYFSIFDSNDENIDSLLVSYLEYSQVEAFKIIINKINQEVYSMRGLLENYLILENEKAKRLIDIEIQKSILALTVAKRSGIKKPLSNYVSASWWGVDLGEDILREKISVLKNINDMALFNESIVSLEEVIKQLEPKPALIKAEKIVTVSEISKPINKTKNKRLLVLFLSCLMGLFFGTVSVLVKKIYL
ncbi:Wzz/FepE/Etk N-terminal domain-containing protein [Vibrio metoecus]|uniref:Wzz/FepE/Etk N-terminal domain-containing protein n=1 Tax=Vibrio metoecus TaxID=1481663 RepID=UPI000BA957FF|nr:Wzz/FepE/Etk N-terminal domain-containing protein [Vibrio metoecus]PAR35702.1 hypothetical protein CGT97_10050 [Vibrio metoecus]PAR44188.1 hypothetical protein CGT96_03650 [Vibrio metoecus]